MTEWARARQIAERVNVTEVDLEHYRAVWGADDDERANADWFCLRVKPWRCPGCGTQFRHAMHGDEQGEHLVVVWPSRDDPNMRTWMTEHFAGKAAIVPYEDALGAAVSYYAIERS